MYSYIVSVFKGAVRDFSEMGASDLINPKNPFFYPCIALFGVLIVFAFVLYFLFQKRKK